MSGQQQPPRYGHGHSQAHDGDPNADNAGGTGGYADIDDDMAMLGYHHSSGQTPLDEYRYPSDRGGMSSNSGDRQYQQRLLYLQHHQHQQRVAAATAAAQAQVHAAAAAAAAASAYGPPESSWHAHLHLHHHHPPGYGRHVHAHAARHAPYPSTASQYGPSPAVVAAAARRSVTGSPVLAKDQRQHQLHVLKSPSASTSATGSELLSGANGSDARSQRSGSQRSTHFPSHGSPSALSSASIAASTPVSAPSRIQHGYSNHHHHHPLPPRPRVHHLSALKHKDRDNANTLNGGASSDSNGYRSSISGSGSGGDVSPDSSSLSAVANTASLAASASTKRVRLRDRSQTAAESRSTAAHEGSAMSTDSTGSSSSDPARVPPSTTSSSSSSNTKAQSATSSAPETVPEPPPEPPAPPPVQRVKATAPAPAQQTAGTEEKSGATVGAPAAAVPATKQLPSATLQLTKDRAWAQSLIEHVSDMVLSLAPNGTIVWASPSARKVVGFTAAELAGRHLGEFVHPEDAQLLTRKLTASIAQSTSPPTNGNNASNGSAADSSFDVTVRFRRKNADYFLIHITGRALLVSNNNIGSSSQEALPEYPGVTSTAVLSPSLDATALPLDLPPTQPFAPMMGIPTAPGIGLHPFALPYNPGNLMAAAAALATPSPFHTTPPSASALHPPAPYPSSSISSSTKSARPPPLLVAICREYPLGDHAAQLDDVVDLRFENELLRDRLMEAYKRKGHSPPPDSALRHTPGGTMTVKLTDIVLPKSNGVGTDGPVVQVPAGAPKKGLSAAVVPSDIFRVAVEKGVVGKAVGEVNESAGESEDTRAGVVGKGKGKGKTKRKHNGIRPSDERVCIDCGVTSSSEWRKGPMGAKTLCNACGLRYAKRKKDEAAARAKAMEASPSATASNGPPPPSDSASQSTHSTSPPTSTTDANGSVSSAASSSPTVQQPSEPSDMDAESSNV